MNDWLPTKTYKLEETFKTREIDVEVEKGVKICCTLENAALEDLRRACMDDVEGQVCTGGTCTELENGDFKIEEFGTAEEANCAIEILVELDTIDVADGIVETLGGMIWACDDCVEIATIDEVAASGLLKVPCI